MEAKIFDKETILDLVVNFIPLGIILFFIGTFAVFAPWGFELMPSGLMFAVMGVMFLALAVLPTSRRRRSPATRNGRLSTRKARPALTGPNHSTNMTKQKQPIPRRPMRMGRRPRTKTADLLGPNRQIARPIRRITDR